MHSCTKVHHQRVSTVTHSLFCAHITSALPPSLSLPCSFPCLSLLLPTLFLSLLFPYFFLPYFSPFSLPPSPYPISLPSPSLLSTSFSPPYFSPYSIAPIFLVSSVTGQGLDLLRRFLNLVPPVQSHRERERLEQEHTEFHVDVIYRVPDAGTVLGGVLTRGVVREGDSVLVGPREDGRLCEERVTTIRRNRTPCRMVRAGQAATITLTHQAVEKIDMRKVSDSRWACTWINRSRLCWTPTQLVTFNKFRHPCQRINEGFHTPVGDCPPVSVSGLLRRGQQLFGV